MPPVNDNYASAQVLTATAGSYSVTGIDLTGATTEAAEVTQNGIDGFDYWFSVWYKLTATADGKIVMHTTEDSNPNNTTHEIQMFEDGGSLATTLTKMLAWDDQSYWKIGITEQGSMIAYELKNGVTYYIRLCSDSSSSHGAASTLYYTVDYNPPNWTTVAGAPQSTPNPGTHDPRMYKLGVAPSFDDTTTIPDFWMLLNEYATTQAIAYGVKTKSFLEFKDASNNVVARFCLKRVGATGSVAAPSQNTSSTTTVTITSHSIGDLLFITARGTAAAPTAPAGWTVLQSSFDATNSFGITTAYKIATATNDTSGTWTNATHMISHVYHPTGGTMAIGSSASNSGGATSTETNWPGLGISQHTAETSCFRAVAYAFTDVANPPSTFTTRSSAGTGQLKTYDRINNKLDIYADVTTQTGTSAFIAHTVEFRVVPSTDNVFGVWDEITDREITSGSNRFSMTTSDQGTSGAGFYRPFKFHFSITDLGFPVAGTLDSFIRANGTLGKAWVDINPGLVISSNKVIHDTADTDAASAYWKYLPSMTDCDVFIQNSTVNLFAVGMAVGARLAGTSTTGADLGDGYWVISTGNGLDSLIHLSIVKSVSGTQTTLLTCTPVSSNASRIGIRCVGDIIQAWYFKGSTGQWTFAGEITDSTYTSGKAGMSTTVATSGGIAINIFGAAYGASIRTISFQKDTGPSTSIAGSAGTSFAGYKHTDHLTMDKTGSGTNIDLWLKTFFGTFFTDFGDNESGFADSDALVTQPHSTGSPTFAIDIPYGKSSVSFLQAIDEIIPGSWPPAAGPDGHYYHTYNSGSAAATWVGNGLKMSTTAADSLTDEGQVWNYVKPGTPTAPSTPQSYDAVNLYVPNDMDLQIGFILNNMVSKPVNHDTSMVAEWKLYSQVAGLPVSTNNVLGLLAFEIRVTNGMPTIALIMPWLSNYGTHLPLATGWPYILRITYVDELAKSSRYGHWHATLSEDLGSTWNEISENFYNNDPATTGANPGSRNTENFNIEINQFAGSEPSPGVAWDVTYFFPSAVAAKPIWFYKDGQWHAVGDPANTDEVWTYKDGTWRMARDLSVDTAFVYSDGSWQ